MHPRDAGGAAAGFYPAGIERFTNPANLCVIRPEGVFSNEIDGVPENDQNETIVDKDSVGAEANEEDTQELEGCEEARRPKTRRAPEQPTAHEVRDHEITHTPYRT